MFILERKFLDFAEACKETHVVSGLLKSFFRELPNPLIPYEFYSGLIDLTSKFNFRAKMDVIIWKK